MAERKLQRAKTASNIDNQSFKLLEWEGDWYEAFDKPEDRGLWFIWGQSGAGKNSFIYRLLKELNKYFRIVLNDLEEGGGHTVQSGLRQYGIANAKGMLWVEEDMDTFSYRLTKHKAPHVAVINSFQYTNMSFLQMYDFRKKHKDKLVIVISQAEGRNPMGKPAKRVMYDSSLKIFVEGYKAFSKGRYIGPNGGTYTIWQEGADRYHGTDGKN